MDLLGSMTGSNAGICGIRLGWDADQTLVLLVLMVIKNDWVLGARDWSTCDAGGVVRDRLNLSWDSSLMPWMVVNEPFFLWTGHPHTQDMFEHVQFIRTVCSHAHSLTTRTHVAKGCTAQDCALVSFK